METGSDGDSRGAGGTRGAGDGVCTDDVRRQARRPAVNGDLASDQPRQRVAGDTGETRPATTTIMGDTGLWFVPTGEVLPAKRWSFSAYRVNFDYNQGFTDVSNWPMTFGVGLGDRAEIFGAWTLVRRIDRDVRPFFLQPAGGRASSTTTRSSRQGWSGNQLGDIWLGAKVNLHVAVRQKPVAFALRGMIKLPTAKDDDEGVGTGKMDFAFDAIVSKEVNERVELSGFGGFIFRGDPGRRRAVQRLPLGLRRGLPTRKSLRLTAELHGESLFGRHRHADTGTHAASARTDRSPPLITDRQSPVNASIGLTWQGKNGVFAGAGLELAPHDGRPQSISAALRGRDGRLARLPVPDRLSPRRADLRAAATAATAAAAAASAGRTGRRR